MKKYKLKELTTIYNGTTYAHLDSGDVPLYGSGGLMGYVDSYLYEGEAVLLPRKGTLNNIMYVHGKFWTVDTMYYAKTNKEIVLPYYLYCYLSLLNLAHLDSGSTLPSMTKAAYNDIEVYLPSIEVQAKIAAVIRSLDKKIELNNRINAELEAMAKTLYDYWFVQFDFPDANGKPYKTSGGKMVYNPILKREIPEGWSSVPLLKITSVSNQLLNPADYPNQVFRHFSIPVYDATKTFGLEAGITIGSNKFTVKKNDILVSKLNPWFNRVIYAMEEENIICSTELVVWRTSSNNIKNFLYMVATSPQFITHCTQSATGTSNSHKRVNPNIMMRFEIPFDKNIAVALGEKLEPMIKKLVINQRENTELAKLRDWLLPMLMNGQVRVA